MCYNAVPRGYWKLGYSWQLLVWQAGKLAAFFLRMCAVCNQLPLIPIAADVSCPDRVATSGLQKNQSHQLASILALYCPLTDEEHELCMEGDQGPEQ